MSLQEITKKIEAILFAAGDPVSKSSLTKTLDVSKQDIEEALSQLEQSLSDRGIHLSYFEDMVSLVTAPDVAPIIEQFLKKDLEGPLSQAALETLSIILYKSGISTPEIDYIRGVNSLGTLRTLLLRGLVERDVNPRDARTFIYRPTQEVFNYLGITNIDQLPNFNNFEQELEAFIQTQIPQQRDESQNPTIKQ